MAMNTLDGGLLRQMIQGAAVLLENNKTRVDALNVFPVPDGDTGTNMSLTLRSAVRQVSEQPLDTVQAVGDALSKGALRGARGNSGVILSQLFRGFAKGLSGLSTVDAKGYAQAMQVGVDMAYKAIMKPQEGTILTVSRQMAAGAVKAAASTTDILEVQDAAMRAGYDALRRTPELLPVLKQAGVVDAGGTGWLVINEGFAKIMRGETIEGSLQEEAPAAQAPVSAAAAHTEEITYGYCTEYMILMDREATDNEVFALREKLGSIGDSVVVVADDTVVKVHAHSNAPGQVIQYGLELGELTNMKIDNMREQHRSLEGGVAPQTEAQAPSVPQEEKEYGIVAVASGDGLMDIFRDLQVDAFIEGGQTMNPSAEDIAEAIRGVPARHVFILPNNSNIILAAQQAAELVEQDAILIPSKTIPQGMSAVLAFDPDATPQDNEAAMREALTTVKTGSVTYAVRDSSFDGQAIHEGNVLGLFEKKIAVVGEDVPSTVLQLLKEMVEDEEVITLFYGQDVTGAEAQELVEKLRAEYPDCDVDAHRGGQPLYYYLISVE